MIDGKSPTRSRSRRFREWITSPARAWVQKIVEAQVQHALLFEIRVVGDASRLHIAPTAKMGNTTFVTGGGHIWVGDYAASNHGVYIITGGHDVTKFGVERQDAHPRDDCNVYLEEGVWLGAGAVLIGPLRIGRHSVVGAGAVVIRDVPPYTVVAGVPAREIRSLTPPGETLADEQ